VAQAYGRLSAAVKVSKEKAAELLGGARMVEELTERGLALIVAATPNQPATFQPVPELTALQTVLVQCQVQLLKHQELLLGGQRRIADLQARPEPVCSADRSASHLIRVITDREEIGRISSYLINSAKKDWMTLETADTDLPISEDNFIRNPYGAAVRVRSISDAACLKNPGALRNLQRSIEAGELIRILPTILMKMQLADTHTVLLPLTPTGTGGAVLIQNGGPIVRALRDYFERLWQVAVPYGAVKPPEGCPLSEHQLQILRLLAMGHTDQTIASIMDCSKSTIEREMDKVEELVNLKGRRFALGVALERRGWVPREEEGNHG
jgi:hypothetical protein